MKVICTLLFFVKESILLSLSWHFVSDCYLVLPILVYLLVTPAEVFVVVTARVGGVGVGTWGIGSSPSMKTSSSSNYSLEFLIIKQL